MEDILINKIETFINTFNVTNFITSIASIILAIVSLVLSILFYRWGNINNKEMTKLYEDIKSKTDSLNALFDKMYNSTFRMVESQNDAMQKKLFNTIGSVESTNIVNLEFEILSEITTSRRINKSSIVHKYNIQENDLHAILEKIKTKNRYIFINGDEIVFNSQDSLLADEISDSSSNKDTK